MHAAHIGSEQLFVFTITVLVTVSTDLLWGIAAGIGAKLILETVMVARAELGHPEAAEPVGLWIKRRLGQTGELFRDPVVKSVAAGDGYHIYFGRPMVCFNSLHLHRQLSLVPGGASAVTIHITDLVTLIDHTTASILLEFVDNFKLTGRGVATIVGLDKLRARSHAEASMRVSPPIRTRDRIEALNALNRVSLTYVEPEVDPITYLERISLTRVGPIAGQDDHPIREAVIHGGKGVARRIRAVARFLRTALVHDEEFKAADRDLAATSLSRTYRGASVPDDIEKFSLSSSRHPLIERRQWWTCLEEVAVTTSQEDHPIRLAFAHAGRLLARIIRSLWQAARGLAAAGEPQPSPSPIEEVGVTSEPMEEQSLASSDDPRDLIE